MIGYKMSTTIFTYFSDQLWRTLEAKRQRSPGLLEAPVCVLRHLPVERPDPKLMLSPDPDRPLGIPAGK
tara:strand:- start:136 stop:342 length:207 start_codon:yes stop_codon:yes gene_type:complete